MKIFICSSKWFYSEIPTIQKELENLGHAIILPNSYENPMKEEEIKKQGKEVHSNWKSSMIKAQEPKVKASDAILVLNFEKNGVQNNIGGATFLEIFKTFELNKKIFLYNNIPENILKDELVGMNPTILNKDLTKIN